jgi:ATP-binding cassette subfamily C (CFTR/MRP) protein 1
MGFVQPQLLSLLIAFIANYHSNGDKPASFGLAVSFGMLIASIFQSIMLHQYFHRCCIVGMNLRAALVSLIYKKALRLSNASRQSSTVGEIVNLMSVDAQRLLDLTNYLHLLWSSPLQIACRFHFMLISSYRYFLILDNFQMKFTFVMLLLRAFDIFRYQSI